MAHVQDQLKSAKEQIVKYKRQGLTPLEALRRSTRSASAISRGVAPSSHAVQAEWARDARKLRLCERDLLAESDELGAWRRLEQFLADW